MSVFISYSSKDEKFARLLYNAFHLNGIQAWFAPKDISGGEDFTEKIGQELTKHKASAEDERIEEDYEKLTSDDTDLFLMMLSKNSMQSEWVKKELIAAINNRIPSLCVQIDHSKLTPKYEYLLEDIQIIQAYHLERKGLEEIISKTARHVHADKGEKVTEERLSYRDIGIFPIASGDPYYREGQTLKTSLTSQIFYLAPPVQELENPTNEDFFREHNFSKKDQVFGERLDVVCKRIPIPGLADMIEKSKRKIFSQFLHHENGCYYNNKKYGIYNLSFYERTEDIAEEPVVRLEFYTTDYYTHRVMKDICKELSKTNCHFFEELDYNHIEDARIFFTSLGVNLLLYDRDENVLVTGRSTNAAETYRRHSYSASVIEGVSYSDYDAYEKRVNLQLSVTRGIREELGVGQHMLAMDSLKFYDIFVNPYNQEWGISCSIELADPYELVQDVLPLKGKDEDLEVADKRVLPMSRLKAFILNNRAAMMPQAFYTFAVFLETQGVFILDKYKRTVLKDSRFIMGKDGNPDLCGDTYVWSDHFIAVIDGATPKGELRWDGRKGDVFVSHLIADAIVTMNPQICAKDAIAYLNQCIAGQYEKRGLHYEKLSPDERLQCSLIIYSVARKEVWSFGDCLLKINERELYHVKEGDRLLAALRAFCIQIEKDRLGPDADEETLSAYGRKCILPYLKQYMSLANRNVPFGYDVLDGGDIHEDHVKVYAIQKNDFVIMASDGYPKLMDTLEETEEYLKRALAEDPMCIGRLRGTKGVVHGNVSFDDRTYLSFRVE